jgi:hypothetical protein
LYSPISEISRFGLIRYDDEKYNPDFGVRVMKVKYLIERAGYFFATRTETLVASGAGYFCDEAETLVAAGAGCFCDEGRNTRRVR